LSSQKVLSCLLLKLIVAQMITLSRSRNIAAFLLLLELFNKKVGFCVFYHIKRIISFSFQVIILFDEGNKA